MLDSLEEEAPVNHMLQYHDHVFEGPLAYNKQYQGPPTKELDENWEALYNSKVSIRFGLMARRAFLIDTLSIVAFAYGRGNNLHW